MRRVLNNHRFTAARCVAAFALALVLAGNDNVLAQSGSRRGGKTAPRRQTSSTSRVQSGSGTSSKKNRVALEGYCPVCIIDMNKWVRGVSEYQAKYDGKTYFFPGPEQQEMFLAGPAKYVPALGGDCVVCFVNMKKRIPGNVRHAALHRKRLFLFPDTKLREEFLASPVSFENADLALDGYCSVCRVEMGKDVPGKPEFTVFHNGMRYLFPAEEQRRMFLANPAKYAVGPS